MTPPYSDQQLAAISAGLEAGKKLEEIVVPPNKAKRLKNNNEESRSQKALIKWWAWKCKDYDIPEQLLFAIPNGMAFGGKEEWQRKTSAIRAKNAKLEGLRPGLCDLMLAVPHNALSHMLGRAPCYVDYHGLFLEMKTTKGVVSPEQTQIHTFLRARGYAVAVCRSTEEAIKAITDYLS